MLHQLLKTFFNIHLFRPPLYLLRNPLLGYLSGKVYIVIVIVALAEELPALLTLLATSLSETTTSPRPNRISPATGLQGWLERMAPSLHLSQHLLSQIEDIPKALSFETVLVGLTLPSDSASLMSLCLVASFSHPFETESSTDYSDYYIDPSCPCWCY
jgi:hypothetical protein